MTTGANRDGRLTIGAVVAALRPDFPDVSISKIRFLEAEGLVVPQRAGSGYRTYAEEDLARLRYVLSAQRDRFWPLKVIRESLDALDRGLTPADPGLARDPSTAGAARGHTGMPRVPPPTVDPRLPTAADLARPGTLRLTPRELRQASGVDEATFEALAEFGLLRADATGHFDDAALAVARAAGELAAYGIEARHLRPFRTAADREVGLVQQATRPLRPRGTEDGGGDGVADERRGIDGEEQEDPAARIAAACLSLHAALVRAGLPRA